MAQVLAQNLAMGLLRPGRLMRRRQPGMGESRCAHPDAANLTPALLQYKDAMRHKPRRMFTVPVMLPCLPKHGRNCRGINIRLTKGVLQGQCAMTIRMRRRFSLRRHAGCPNALSLGVAEHQSPGVASEDFKGPPDATGEPDLRCCLQSLSRACCGAIVAHPCPKDRRAKWWALA